MFCFNYEDMLLWGQSYIFVITTGIFYNSSVNTLLLLTEYSRQTFTAF